jgi:hypothetical protein
MELVGVGHVDGVAADREKAADPRAVRPVFIAIVALGWRCERRSRHSRVFGNVSLAIICPLSSTTQTACRRSPKSSPIVSFVLVVAIRRLSTGNTHRRFRPAYAFWLASFTELRSNPSGITTHIQYSGHSCEVVCHVVVDGERESARQESMKPKMHRVDAGIQAERFEIGHETVQEIAPHTRLPFVVETASGLQILRSFLKEDDSTDTHYRN